MLKYFIKYVLWENGSRVPPKLAAEHDEGPINPRIEPICIYTLQCLLPTAPMLTN